MKQKPGEPSPLQADLLLRIVTLIRENGWAEGSRLREVDLATRLQVSRTPVRAALAHLARRGLVREAGRGFSVADWSAPPAAREAAALADAAAPDERARLALRIAESHVAGLLGPELSEAELMRRYGVGRPLLQRVLTELAELGVVERRPGKGWMFLPAVTDPVARAESYRWRMTIEPAALLEPGYALAPEWVASMRERHEAMLAAPWRQTTSLAFFEMNAAFHEGLAGGAANRFFLLAVQQQNRLRRLSNYNWAFARDQGRVRARVAVNCREHLEILARAAGGEGEIAAAALRAHLRNASGLHFKL